MVGRPGADEGEGRLAGDPVVRASRRLAVERYDPAEEAPLALLKVERGEGAPDGVVGRDAVGERQEGARPGELGVAA